MFLRFFFFLICSGKIALCWPKTLTSVPSFLVASNETSKKVTKFLKTWVEKVSLKKDCTSELLSYYFKARLHYPEMKKLEKFRLDEDSNPALPAWVSALNHSATEMIFTIIVFFSVFSGRVNSWRPCLTRFAKRDICFTSKKICLPIVDNPREERSKTLAQKLPLIPSTRPSRVIV